MRVKERKGVVYFLFGSAQRERRDQNWVANLCLLLFFFPLFFFA